MCMLVSVSAYLEQEAARAPLVRRGGGGLVKRVVSSYCSAAACRLPVVLVVLVGIVVRSVVRIRGFRGIRGVRSVRNVHSWRGRAFLLLSTRSFLDLATLKSKSPLEKSFAMKNVENVSREGEEGGTYNCGKTLEAHL